MQDETVGKMTGLGLCTGCGTCAGVCPTNAIKMQICNRLYQPKIEEDKCTHCELCIKSCPGHSVDFSKLEPKIFGKKSKDKLLGNQVRCYIGYSNDDKIRYDSSSGGMVTQLLIFLLEKGIIDGALVVRMREDQPLEPEPFIARTKEEIISTSKSKYCPVPANIALKKILLQEGKFAVVGLPCHIQGVRKTEILNKKLKEKIILHMGLFCSHSVDFSGTGLLLEKLGIDKHDVKQLNYRGRGWPGHISVVLSNGHQMLFNYLDYWRPLFGAYFFTPLRCLCCYDLANELADLSFGDAWLKDIMNKDKKGTSIVISRSKIGEELLRRAELERVIALERIDAEKVVKSQFTPLYSKKLGLGARVAILKSFGMRTPTYSEIKLTRNPFLYLVSLLQLLDAIFSQRKSAYNILKNMPLLCLRGWGASLYYFEFLSYRLLGGGK